MRDYGKIGHKMWADQLWRDLSNIGVEAFAICSYLQSGPASTMLGIYRLSLEQIEEALGLSLKKTKYFLEKLIEINYCSYDYELKYIWIHEMAEMEIGALKINDNQVKGVQTQFNRLPQTPLTIQYYEKYKDLFHIVKPEWMNKEKPLTSVSPSSLSNTEDDFLIAPDKPLRSQKQIQEQIQLQDQDQKTEKEDSHVRLDTLSPDGDASVFFESSNLTRPEENELQDDPGSGTHHSSNKREVVTRIFKYWQTELEHPLSKLDDKRKRCIERALKQGFTIDELESAIRGCKRSPYHMGDNKTGQVYDDLTLILRDASHIENFMERSKHNNDPYGIGVSYRKSRDDYDPTIGAI